VTLLKLLFAGDEELGKIFDLDSLPPGVGKDDEDLFIKAQQVCLMISYCCP
jgi:hypothetical protein